MVTGVGGGVAVSAEALQHKKLVDAAQQFEGMFLQQMLKPMGAKSEGDEGSEGEDGGGVGDSTYRSLGVEAMAKAIAASGGMGIAKRVVTQVEKEARKHESGTGIGQR